MQNIPAYPAPGSHRIVDVEVLINDVPHDVEEVNIDATGGGSLPPGMSGLSEVFAATGNIRFARRQEATAEDEKIQGAVDRPRRGDRVTISTIEDGVKVRQFTGRIKNTSGGHTLPLSATIEDESYRLRKQVELPPLAATMPPLDAAGKKVTGMGVNALFGIDRVLRFCGFNATPPNMKQGLFFSAPMMGSAWPERARLIRAGKANQSGIAVFTETPWGMAATDLDAAYNPASAGPWVSPLEFSFLATGRTGWGGNTSIICAWNDATWAGVRVTADRKAYVVTCVGGIITQSSLVPLPAGEARIGARINPNGDYVLHIFQDGAQTGYTSGRLPAANQWLTDGNFEVRVNTPPGGVDIAGIQIGYTGASHWNDGWSRNSFLGQLSTGNAYYALPAYYGRTALDIIKEAVSSDLASAWVDEYGNFHLRNRDAFTAGDPVDTIQADARLYDYGWDDGDGTAYTNVRVDYREPAVTANADAVSTVWEGSSQSLNQGERINVIASPKDGENWLVPDFTPDRVAPASAGDAIKSFDRVNRGYGSYYGGVITNKNGDYDWASTNRLGVVKSTINFETFKFEFNAAGLAADQSIEFRTVKTDKATTLWPSMQGKPLPVIRAKGVIRWLDQAATLGPGDNLGEYPHSGGYWIQDKANADQTAAYVLAQLTNGLPVIHGFDVLPDARYQHGDKINVVDLDMGGTNMVAVIVGKHLNISPGRFNMTLDLRTLKATRFITWGEVDRARASLTYAANQAHQNDRTYGTEIIP